MVVGCLNSPLSEEQTLVMSPGSLAWGGLGLVFFLNLWVPSPASLTDARAAHGWLWKDRKQCCLGTSSSVYTPPRQSVTSIYKLMGSLELFRHTRVHKQTAESMDGFSPWHLKSKTIHCVDAGVVKRLPDPGEKKDFGHRTWLCLGAVSPEVCHSGPLL